MDYQETKKVYDSILKIAKKYKDSLNYDFSMMELTAKNHLFGLELKEKYGLNVDLKRIDNIQWKELKRDVYLTYMDGINRKISWSDNDKQPKGEYLILLKYPTGAYLFGNDYPTDFFQKFWLELKSFNPDYIDTTNRCLYFKLSNAKEIFNQYDSIVKKYYDLNKEDFKQREILRIENELQRLKQQK